MLDFYCAEARLAGEIDQVALGFLTRRASLFAIPKASNPEHAEENAGTVALHLSAAELAKIDAAFPLGPRPRSLPML